MLIFALLLAVGASPCDAVVLEAVIGADLRAAHGTVTCAVGSSGALEAATYPQILRTERGLDDVNRQWFYPEGFDAAEMRLARDGTVLAPSAAWQPLGEVAAGEMVRLEFWTRVPRRNGTFGLSGTTAYLLGGWHPAFGRQGRLDAIRIRYQIRVPPGTVGLVGSQRVGRETTREIRGEHVGRFVPVVLAPAVNVTHWINATLIEPLAARHGSIAGLRDVSAFLDTRAYRELEATLESGRQRAAASGIRDAPHLFLVVAPLREHLVEAFDGGLAVSNRAFHLLPCERFEKFHRLTVWRHQLAALARPTCARVEEDLPADLVADLVGSALRDRLTFERYGGKEYAPDLLETFAVIPEIDALIFAPQVAFRDTYFQAIDETPLARWQLDDFFHERPRGKLLYEKLVDALGAPRVQQLVDAYLADPAPLLKVAARIGEPDLARLVRPWLGPYPRLDYAIGRVRSTQSEVAVDLVVSGPDARTIAEPITVEIEDDDGEIHRARRIGPGEVLFDAPGPPHRVEIDPDGRLVELHHKEGEAPRFNNRDPKRWRFLLNNISSLIAVTNEQIKLSVDFSLRRIHDLRYRTNFYALYGPAAIGGATTFSYGFGQEVTPLHLAQRVGLSVLYERLRSERGHGEPAHQGTLIAWYRYDDRLNPYWSFEGKGIAARVAGTVSLPDHGDPGLHALVGVGGFYILPIAFGHALLGRLRGDLLVGDALKQNELRLGSLYRGARGYERDEAFGRRRAIATLEYRHVLEGSGRTDLGGLLTWTRLEGGLFADAVYIPVNRPRCRKSFFFDVGYGLRFIGDVLNVTPAAVAIDFGLPLSRCADERDRRQRQFTVYVSFVQSLASF